jgi:nitrogen fixation protein NifU and related proteins
MFDDLRDLYQEVILDHGRSPRHGRRLEVFDATARGDNPMCGDRVTVFVRHDGEAVDEVGFEARGCAISIASADLMAEAAVGKTADDISKMAAAFTAMARAGHTDDPALDRLRPLAGVHDYPSRVKCATLPWVALQAALAGGQDQGVATSE